jgi:hypothetical protein
LALALENIDRLAHRLSENGHILGKLA